LERLSLTLTSDSLQQDNIGFDAETIGFNLGLARNSVGQVFNVLIAL
jgi:sigma-54 dependent dga operon transcriptional activator